MFRGRTPHTRLTPADGPVLPLGSWTHLVGTFDGSTVRLYVNGALFSSAPASGPLSGGAGQSFIGRLGQGVFPFQGTLDEVAVFPSALSAERVRAHYQASSAASVRVSASASAAGTLRATATATGAEADPDPSSNSLSLTSTVSAPRADLVRAAGRAGGRDHGRRCQRQRHHRQLRAGGEPRSARRAQWGQRGGLRKWRGAGAAERRGS